MNLIVSDFDGTFFDENYEENIKFINSIRDKYDFVIATGRHFKSLSSELKIECDYYICNDGSYILDKNKNIIYKNYINQKSIETVYNRMLELGYDDYFFDYIDGFGTELKDNITKLSIRITDNTKNNDIDYLISDLEDVYGYISTNWINIISIESKKENGIEEILKYKNYNKIIVFGNEINDYGMLDKYDGYLISKKFNNKYKTLEKFIDIKKKL